VALVDGAIEERSFDAARLSDPRLLALMDVIELVEDPTYTEAFPGRMSCRFELELRDGNHLTHLGHHPRGHPDNPMTDAELETKFLAQIQPKYGPEGAQRLGDKIWNFESETSVETLLALVR
jgi:2-methylcitrate dehydratase PrpD